LSYSLQELRLTRIGYTSSLENVFDEIIYTTKEAYVARFAMLDLFSHLSLGRYKLISRK
jgi:hypothetical protein